MSQIYKKQQKRPQVKENQLGILEISLWNLRILLEIQQRPLGPETSNARVTYLYLRIHPKGWCIFPLKVVTTLLSGSGKGTVGA